MTNTVSNLNSSQNTTIELDIGLGRRSEAHTPPAAGQRAVAACRGGEAGGAVRPPGAERPQPD